MSDVQWLHLVGLLKVLTKNWCTFGLPGTVGPKDGS